VHLRLTWFSLLDRRHPLLPLAPGQGREPRLARGRCVGPDHYRLVILPLDGDGFVSDLEAALIHLTPEERHRLTVWPCSTTILTALALAPPVVLLGVPLPLFAGQGLLGLAGRQLPLHLLARQGLLG
jgi:hypothetical protein